MDLRLKEDISKMHEWEGQPNENQFQMPPKIMLILFPTQVRHSLKSSATPRCVGLAHRAMILRGCSAWRRPARIPTTPRACATMATSWATSRGGASPAPCARWVKACCTAASLTTTQCARSAGATRTPTRRVLGSPASPATPARTTRSSVPAPQSRTLSVRVSQSPRGDNIPLRASSRSPLKAWGLARLPWLGI